MVYKLKAMDMWYRHLPGRYIIEQEKRLLDSLLPLMPGDNLLQIGGPSDGQLLSASVIKNKSYLHPEHVPNHDDNRLQVDLSALPVQSDSVDVVVLVHLMGFCEEPRLLLEEVYRCLKPGGQLVVLGFNYWGLWSLLRFNKNRKGYPWQGRFQSVYQVRRWLYRASFQVLMSRTLCFFPPEKKKRSMKWLHRLEKMMEIVIPGAGSVYMALAQKRATGSDPLVANWLQDKLAVKKARPEPSYMKRQRFPLKK